VALARELENLRWGVERVTNAGRFEERIPTQVYVLPHRVGQLGLTHDTVGYLVPAMRANHAVLAPVERANLPELIRHEYVHFLIRNRDGLAYPTWYDEGFAQLLSTLELKDGVLSYGKATEYGFDWLGAEAWFGFEGILERRSTQELSGPAKGMFYAQSWLLVHYLTLGRKGHDTAAELTRFLALSESGVPRAEAFEQAFGVTVVSLERLLQKHMRRLPYVQLRLSPLPTLTSKVAPLPADAVAARLGALALVIGEHESAGRFADAALALNADNAAALVVRADVLGAAGRFAEAEPLHRRALELEPGSALHELDLGEHFLARAARERDPARAKGYLAEARSRFARSHRLDPENPEPLAVHGASYLDDLEPGSGEKAVASLEAAHERLPSQAEIKLLLARAYVTANQPERARPLLRRVATWAESSWASEASELLAALEAAPRADPQPGVRSNVGTPGGS
jgi:tetratricopeptide (TPR) repeat protein